MEFYRISDLQKMSDHELDHYYDQLIEKSAEVERKIREVKHELVERLKKKLEIRHGE